LSPSWQVPKALPCEGIHWIATWCDCWNARQIRRSKHRGPSVYGPKKANFMTIFSSLPRTCAISCLAVLMGGCSSVGLGVSVPLIPGVSIGVGVGSGGVNAGVSAGRGPVSAGVGVSQSGQVRGNAGVGVSTGVGGASVGAGVGVGGVIHDPDDSRDADRRQRGLAR